MSADPLLRQRRLVTNISAPATTMVAIENDGDKEHRGPSIGLRSSASRSLAIGGPATALTRRSAQVYQMYMSKNIVMTILIIAMVKLILMY